MTTPIRLVPGTLTTSIVGEGEPTSEHVPAIEKAELMGMKVRLSVDSAENNELRAIGKLRSELGGVEVVEDSWHASWAGYITKEEPYDETVAVDVRGVLFPYVHKYENRRGTLTKIVGEWWVASVLVWPSSVTQTSLIR